MTEPLASNDSDGPRNGPGCGSQVLCLLVIVALLWLFPYVGWWPRQRGFGTGLAVTGTAALGIGLAVALMGLWDRVRRR